ncbi:hypothetical protein JCM10908_005950 [Rhodotorula pacifica]|uniref:cysteine hydrolase family protein n=1 Tax=Rhodotorula pacifica TaxID=1495444 RepID=UPI00317F27EE
MTTPAAPSHFRFRDVNPLVAGPTTASVKDSALIVIDNQNFYLPEGTVPTAGIEKANEVISKLVDKYRARGGEIVWVAHTFDSHKTHDEIKGTPLDFAGNLRPQGDELYVSKLHGSRRVS